MNFLITAGPTREPLDPVRFLSNRSSGKMGYAMAEAALEAGHQVTLISGPVCLAPPPGATLINVTTSDEMADAVHAHLGGVEVAVLCAAVADFKPTHYSPLKLKKRDGMSQIALIPTRDILASLGALESRRFLLAGFAAETNDLAGNAQRKLREKRCDVIIANDVSQPGIGFESEENAVTLYFQDQASRVLPRAGKHELGRALIKIIVDCAIKKLT
jgi:phosphopantothenoylcysteine synthetase/decarboxylase